MMKPAHATKTTANQQQAVEEVHEVSCLEIVGGNEVSHNTLAAPGMDIFIESIPYGGSVGGDLHYLTICGSGRVTRIAVADVSGHGPGMDATTQMLRRIMQKHKNLLDQTKLARAVNREFTLETDDEAFATVLFVTYFAPTQHLIICNGGHPPPLWYHRSTDIWQAVDEKTQHTGPSVQETTVRYRMSSVSNLPLGVIEPTDYYQFTMKLDPGDLVVLYTDALIEAKNPDKKQLGQQGLLEIMRHIDPHDPSQIAREVFRKLDDWRAGGDPDDDQTVVVMHHNATAPTGMNSRLMLRSILRAMGLRRD